MYSIEIKGSWFGVAIPAWLRVFDVRGTDADLGHKSPWGSTLWSSERAEVDLGLRGEQVRNATAPVNCSTYTDARTAPQEELARQVADMIQAADKLRLEYQAATHHLALQGQGGSVLYLPVAVYLANYGWGVIADKRTQIVRSFQRG